MSRRNYLIYTTIFLIAIAGMVLPAYIGSRPAVPVAQNTPATSTSVTAAAAAPVSRAQQPSAAPSAQPTAVDAGSTRTSYTIPVLASGTVLDAMRAFASSSAFSFTGRDYPTLGFFVESINGMAAAHGSNWMLYVNGKQSSKGASSATVAPGDTVEWRYEE